MTSGYLGIDVSKGYADFALLNQQKQPLEEVFQLDDTSQGHKALKALVKKFISRHSIQMLYCGVESTGGFENNWYGSLSKMQEEMPIKVARLNPYGVKQNAQASLRRNVTDALSAGYIAEYLISHSDTVDYTAADNIYSSFRSLHNHICLLTKQKTQLINQLKAVLYSAFPEMIRYCKNSIPVWVLEALKKYPTACEMARAKAPALSRIKHISADKAQMLIDKAKHSIASRADTHHRFLIADLAGQIIGKQDKIQKYKSYLEIQCTGKEVTLLQSIKGVGTYSAVSMMIEIEDIKRFASPKHLASYFGVHPALRQSGDKEPAYRMSKQGRASMRATLYMCASSAALWDPHLKSIYHRHRQKAKTHKQAIGVIMHKLLRICWGILSKDEAYNSQTDQKNQQRQAGTEKTPHPTKQGKRRFQPLDDEAPVSLRQTQKRKALQESQVPINGEQMRDHPSMPLSKIE